MANLHINERASKLYSKRQMYLDNHLIVEKIRRFTDHSVQFPFHEYFYKAEHVILRTNDFEPFESRTKKSGSTFRDYDNLQTFIDDMPNVSSNDEDRPPPSEELFMESDDVELYDKLVTHGKYLTPLTKLQRVLLRNLARYVFDKGDNQKEIEFKREHRLDLIRGFCKDLKRKRYAKAYKRFKTVREQGLDVGNEGLRLLEAEIADKNLNRPHYYAEDEPKKMRTNLLVARTKAIKRKYLQYVTDPNFRRSYRDRIYFNVNLDVPATDQRHMHGCVFIVEPNLMNQTVFDRVQLDALDSSTATDLNSTLGAFSFPLANSTPIHFNDRFHEMDDLEYPHAMDPHAKSNASLPPPLIPSTSIEWLLKHMLLKIKAAKGRDPKWSSASMPPPLISPATLEWLLVHIGFKSKKAGKPKTN